MNDPFQTIHQEEIEEIIRKIMSHPFNFQELRKLRQTPGCRGYILNAINARMVEITSSLNDLYTVFSFLNERSQERLFVLEKLRRMPFAV